MMLKLSIFRKKKLFERMFKFEVMINNIRWYRSKRLDKSEVVGVLRF